MQDVQHSKTLATVQYTPFFAVAIFQVLVCMSRHLLSSHMNAENSRTNEGNFQANEENSLMNTGKYRENVGNSCKNTGTDGKIVWTSVKVAAMSVF